MTRARVLADLGNSGTFSANADTNRVGISSANPTATLDVTGDVNVSSAATFGGNVTVGGVLTYEDVTNVDSVGVLTARLGANISGGDGLKVTANGAQITGVSTFSSAIDANGDLDVDGQTDLDNLVVAGVSTFSSLIDLNAELDVDGQTDLDNLIVAGVSTFSADVSIADKIIHTGDTNTAIRFPAADTFAIETSGSERVRVTSAGLIGIGTETPETTLTVRGTSDGVLNLDTADSRGAFIRFGQGSSYHNMVGCADGLVEGPDKEDLGLRATDSIIFAAGGATERGRITSAGKIGIGLTNPLQTVVVKGTSDNGGNQYSLIQSDTSNATGGGGFEIAQNGTRVAVFAPSGWLNSNTGSDAALHVPTGKNFIFYNHTTEALRITSAGRILKGVTTARGNYANNSSGAEIDHQIEGTSYASSSLSLIRNSNDANDGAIVLGKTRATVGGGSTVVQAGDHLGDITFAGADGTSLQHGVNIIAEVQSGVGNDDMPTDLIFKTNEGTTSTTERLRIKSDGKIGINNSDPLYPMHFKNAMGSSPSYIHMEVTGSNVVGGGGGIQFDTSATSVVENNSLYLATIEGVRNSADDGSNDLVFKTSHSGAVGDDGNTHSPKEKLRIKSDGKIGIGQTNPQGNLHIGNISGSHNIIMHAANNGDATIRFREGGNTASGFNEYSIGMDGSRNAIVVNGQGAGEIIAIKGDTGLVGIGTNNPEEILHILGPSEAVNNRDGVMLQHTTATADADTGLPIVWSGHIGNNDNYGLAAVCGRKANSTSGNAAGYLQFATCNTSGALEEKMRVHPDGTISIGRATSSDPNRYVQVHNADAASSAYFQSTNTGTGSGASDGIVMGMGDATNAYLWNYEAGAIIFATSATQQAMVDSSGNFLVGKAGSNFANAGCEIRNNGEAVLSRDAGDVLTTRRLSSEGTHVSFRANNGNVIGTISTNGSNTSYNTSSDYRLKENIHLITDGIARLNQLTPKRFNFITNPDLTVDGFIAHEAQTVVPESVTGEKDGEEMQVIDQSKLVPLLTAALKEAIAKIESLEKRIESLES